MFADALHMIFEIIEKDWFKRREPNKIKRKVLEVRIPDYKQEQNHFCDMFVTYDDGTEAKYIARVIYNKINDYWTVDGMHVSVKVID